MARMAFVHRGQAAEPEDARSILEGAQACRAFYGASSTERLPAELARTERTREFKRIGRGTARGGG
jgi:predicted TIM-barrel enzyme